MLTSVQYEVLFSVRAETRPGEVVCVTGDCPELGNWIPNKAIKLRRQKERNVWSRQKTFQLCKEKFNYRYFTAQVFQPDNEEEDESLIISLWETNYHFMVDIGKEDANSISTFGEYDNQHHVSGGWLIDQSQITIHFHDNPIKMWNTKYRNQTYSIKCTPIDHRYRDELTDEEGEHLPHATNSWIQVSVLEQGRSVPQQQGPYGTVYAPDNYMICMVQTLDPETTGFQIDLYVHDASSDDVEKDTPPRHVGYTFILPLDLQKTTDKKTVPITSMKHKPLGQITFDYLLIKPMTGQRFNMEVSYQNYWKSTRQALDIGHRGMGVSFGSDCTMMATVPENTIQSLMDAASHGADMVEFDVHLTKDKQVIIYHDFKVNITYKKKRQGELELLEIPVKDLKLSELQHMKLWHKPRPDDLDEIHTEDLDPENLQPFPTLQQCLQAVDLHTGFNIEFKYPQPLRKGTHEQEHYYDLNEFIDTILRVVFEYHGGRRIVFSTFDCDTCVALRLKQNKYPVLLLTQADTTAYDWYHDMRTHSVKTGTEFCLAHSLLGLNAMSELLLKDMSLIDYVKNSGLVLFTWGNDNNNTETIEKLKQCRADAIIYDRIDRFKTTGKESVFKVEHNEKMKFFQKFAPDNDITEQFATDNDTTEKLAPDNDITDKFASDCDITTKPLTINIPASGSDVPT